MSVAQGLRGRGRSSFGFRTPRRCAVAPAQHKQPRSAGCGVRGRSAQSGLHLGPAPARGGDTVARGLREPTPEQGPPPPHARSHRALRDARFARVSERLCMVPSVQRKPDLRSRGCRETPDLQRHRKPRRRLRAGGAFAPASGEGGARAGRGSQSREPQRGAGAALWPRTTGQMLTPRSAPPQPSLSAEGARAGVTVPIGANSTCHQCSPVRAPSHFPPDPQTAVPHPRGAAVGRPQPGGKPLSSSPAPSSRN